jgi:Rps23 Pro-64 3,4-dihydroxylase Tpa1-like proline 4-hydroxylase
VRLFNARKINLRFHWHYTPNGCSVSPHTDSVREHGSQLFYFNSDDDWDPAWGGDTLVLDDGGRLKFETAPSFEDFGKEIAAKSIGNYSLIFQRTRHSWHAVREILCPEERVRRVFIVVVNPENLYRTIRDRVMGKKVQRF